MATFLSVSMMLPQAAASQGWCKVERDAELMVIRLPENTVLQFTNQRPSTDEALLCIPAAYTSPEGTIMGAYIIDGQLHNRYNRHSKVSLSGNTFSLSQEFTTGNGFQQMCLVRHHQAVAFHDPARRIRRALCKENEHAEAIIVESRKPLTMNEFAQLLARRMETAVYTDMGSFGYGWYRSESGLHRLSTLWFYNRKKQTNWLVARRSVQ